MSGSILGSKDKRVNKATETKQNKTKKVQESFNDRLGRAKAEKEVKGG